MRAESTSQSEKRRHVNFRFLEVHLSSSESPLKYSGLASDFWLDRYGELVSVGLRDCVQGEFHSREHSDSNMRYAVINCKDAFLVSINAISIEMMEGDEVILENAIKEVSDHG